MTDGTLPPDIPPPASEPADRLAPGEVRPGLILNGIYRVERAVARGGMGQVFEGTNVETDERVAIKVVHRHLASDSKVQAMFRKEARILTQLSHPAIAHYRVLARDPMVDVTYIVTDFIDGRPLLDLLNGQSATVADIQALGRRLADGLEAAHVAGAIHRDISPDNVLIGEGGIGEAKIIDFGIARDLAVGAETVIGDGFAGKIGYVAPEQFGDFGRSIGPWTDVYSLALVLIAFARGKAPDMGSSLAEAVERRRSKPDLTEVPDILRPLLARMLTPDPRQRMGAMSDVRAALEQLTPLDSRPGRQRDSEHRRRVSAIRALWRKVAHTSPTVRVKQASDVTAELTVFAPIDSTLPLTPPMSKAGVVVTKTQGGSETKPNKVARAPRLARGRRIALVALATLIVGGVSFYWMMREHQEASSFASSQHVTPTSTTADIVSMVEVASPELGCAWLDWSARQNDGDDLLLHGAAANPAAASEAAMQSVQTMDIGAATVDGTGVLRLADGQCPAVDALRKFRAIDSHTIPTLRVEQSSFELARGAQGCPLGAYARPVVTAAPADPANEFALLAVLPSGRVRLISENRAALKALGQRYPDRFGEIGNGRTRITLCENAKGVMGIAMVEAPLQPALGLVRGQDAASTLDWTAALIKAGRSQGWSVRMAWFSLTDEQADPTQAMAAKSSEETAPPNARPRRMATMPYMAPAAGPEKEKAGAAADEHKPDYAACRRYDGRWREMGYASLSGCSDRIFGKSCSVQSGQSGDVALRRYDGRIEAMGGRYGRWTRLASDRCARSKDPETAPPPKSIDRIY